MKYIIKFGNYYIGDFYTDSDFPSISFMSKIDLTVREDRAFRFNNKTEAECMINILCDNLQIYEDKTSFIIEEVKGEDD